MLIKSNEEQVLTRLQLLYRTLLFILGYFIAAELGNLCTPAGHNFCTFWPASGFYLACLLLTPRRYWWIYLIGLIPPNLISNLLHDRQLFVSLVYALGNAIEAFVGAYLIDRLIRRIDGPFRFVNIMSPVLLIVIFALTIGATFGGAVTSWFYGAATTIEYWRLWFFSSFIGIISVTPLMLFLSSPPSGQVNNTHSKYLWERIAIILMSLAVWALIFSPVDYYFISQKYLALAFLIICASRLPARDFSILAFTLTLLAFIWGKNPGAKDIWHAHDPESLAFSIQFFTAVCLTLGYFVFVLLNERRYTINQLLSREKQLTEKGSELKRSQAVAHIGHWTWDTQTNALEWSDEMYNIFGIPPDTPLNDLNRIVNITIHPEDREQVFASNSAVVSEGRHAPLEYRVIWPDGSVRTVFAVPGDIVKDSTGQIIKLSGVVHDITALKEAEQAQANSEQVYSALFENMLNGFAYCKMLYLDGKPDDFIYLRVNQAFVDLTGLKDVEDRKVSEVIPGIQESDPQLFEIYGRVASGAGPARFETFVEALKTWFSVSVYSPQAEHFVAVFEVITARKQAETTLRESRELLRAILDTIPVRVFWKDKNLCYLGCNSPFAQDAGYNSPEDIIGKDDYAMGWHEQAERYRQDDQSVINTGIARQLIEEPQTTPLGETIYLLTSKVPLRDVEGNVTGVLGSYFDISARKKVEEALSRSENQYRMLVETPLFPVVVSSLSTGLVLYMNKFACGFFGLEPAKAIGMQATEFMVDVTDRNTFIDRILKEGEVAGFEARLSCAGNQIKTVLISACGTQFEGEPAAFFVFMDITDRKSAETENQRLSEQLLQAQKMEAIGRLAGGVAHDFNNMLTAITVNAEMSISQLPSDDPLLDHQKEILSAAKRSATLTNQLLAFARKQTVLPRIIDLNESVENTLKMLRRLIGENIDLTWQAGIDVGQIKIDPTQFDQLLANLIVNARDAIWASQNADSQGLIRLESDKAVVTASSTGFPADIAPGSYAKISISDNGCGMSPEVIARIFDPFFTTKQQGEGTGLGLSIVFGIVKQNEGSITVHSIPDEGTTFTIYLPTCQGPTRESEQTFIPKFHIGGSETILLVEDEVSVIYIAKSFLEGIGYKIITVSDPEAALELGKNYDGEIDLLLTDVVMPNMDGSVLAQKLAELRPGIKRIFMSGYTSDIPLIEKIASTEMNFIQKPFSMGELAQIVRRVLDS
jgi:PAS domain S-box-containing protein